MGTSTFLSFSTSCQMSRGFSSSYALGVVLAAEKKVTSKLLEPKGSSEKMYRLDNHVAAAVAGLTADVPHSPSCSVGAAAHGLRS